MGPHGIPSVGARWCLGGKGAPPVSGAWGLACSTLTGFPGSHQAGLGGPSSPSPAPLADIQVEANLGAQLKQTGGNFAGCLGSPQC